MLENDQLYYAVLLTEGQAQCNCYFKEIKSLNVNWKQAQQEADNIEGPLNFDSANQKIGKLYLAIDLRRQISARFYGTGGDTTNYIQWIIKLKQDIWAFADRSLGKFYTISITKPN